MPAPRSAAARCRARSPAKAPIHDAEMCDCDAQADTSHGNSRPPSRRRSDFPALILRPMRSSVTASRRVAEHLRGRHFAPTEILPRNRCGRSSRTTLGSGATDDAFDLLTASSPAAAARPVTVVDARTSRSGTGRAARSGAAPSSSAVRSCSTFAPGALERNPRAEPRPPPAALRRQHKCSRVRSPIWPPRDSRLSIT